MKWAIKWMTVCIAVMMFGVPLSAYANWEIMEVDVGDDTGRYCDLAIDAIGNYHVSYFDDTTDTLNYASFDGANWTIHTIAMAVSGKTSIALDAGMNPHIVCKEDTMNRYWYHDGSTWQNESFGTGEDYLSLALDSTGSPCVVGFTNALTINYYYKSGGWQDEPVHPGADYGLFASLVLDSSDIPHVSYYTTLGQDLWYASKDTMWNQWQVDTTNNVGEYTSIALNPAGDPGISYYDAFEGDLNIAQWDGSTWIIETVDNLAIDTGRFTSIVYDSSGNPHISFMDFQNVNLKYAHWDGAAWIIEDIDNMGSYSIDAYTAIALDPLDRLVIAYYYNIGADADLRVARYFESEQETQGDWSGGPGQTDPVTEWGNTFASEANIEYGVPGQLTLKETKDDYFENGDLASAILDLGVEANPRWVSIGWNADTPKAETGVAIQMRTGNAWGAMGAWSGDITMPGSLAGVLTNGQRYVQYKVKLSTDNVALTPTFFDIEIVWEDSISTEEAPEPVVPTGFSLAQSYPNPTDGSATIKFGLPYTSEIKLELFDIKGRKVAVLADGKYGEGEYDKNISGLASGIYLYRLSADGYSNVKKMIVK